MVSGVSSKLQNHLSVVGRVASTNFSLSTILYQPMHLKYCLLCSICYSSPKKLLIQTKGNLMSRKNLMCICRKTFLIQFLTWCTNIFSYLFSIIKSKYWNTFISMVFFILHFLQIEIIFKKIELSYRNYQKVFLHKKT